VVRGVSASREPVFVTQRGRAAAVLLSMEAYEDSQREIEALRLLARGEKEIDAGIGHELGDVLKEADHFLEAARP
jgi:prevent-host-death family protein